MRIAFAHYSEANDISGVTSWLIQLALYLKEQGHSVAIHMFDLCQPGETSPLEMALQHQGIDLSKSTPTGNLRRDTQATLAFLNHWQPDLFLPQCKPQHYVAAAIAGRAGLPWALVMHCDDPDYWATLGSLPPSDHGGITVCVSSHIAANLHDRHSAAEAIVIPCGVAIPSTTTTRGSGPLQVVYSGRLWEHQKRASLVTETLIRACRRGDGRITATLIGDGYSRAACTQLVRDAGLEGRIRFAGRLLPAEVQEILLGSQALLLMSDFEGLPVALLEAMAAGVVPVVRSIPSGIPEVVHHGTTGLLVSEDPDEAADALLQLADNPALWQRCSTGARQLVEQRFSSAICHRKWLDVLQTLSATSPRPTYPIVGLHGVRLSRLSPVMTASYRKPAPWRSWQLRQRLAIRVARLKGVLKQRLQG